MPLSSRPRLLSPQRGSRWASARAITLPLTLVLDLFAGNSSTIQEIDGFRRSLASQEDAVLLCNLRPKDRLGSCNSDHPQMLWGLRGCFWAQGCRPEGGSASQILRTGENRALWCMAQLCAAQLQAGQAFPLWAPGLSLGSIYYTGPFTRK